MRRSLFAGLALTGAMPVAASAQTDPDFVIGTPGNEIIVRGGGPFPRCEMRPGDPLDALRETARPTQPQWADPNWGSPRLVADPNPVTGPEIWQRAGFGLTSFTFRVPDDGTPLCIGNHSGTRGYGQLRRILNAQRYVGRYARFTAFISAPRDADVRVWVSGGNSAGIMIGDGTGRNVITTGGYEPLSVTIGPLPRGVTKLSYGFLLNGQGDVWLSEPQLDFIDQPVPDTGRR